MRRKSTDGRRRLLLEVLEDRTVPSAIAGSPNPNEVVDTTLTSAQLAQMLVGPGVAVSNVAFTGGSGASGSFSFTDPTVLGFGQGIVLSSGNAADVVGPNTSDWTSTDFGLPGDPALDTLSTYPTHDAAILEFDFTPVANQVVFQYVFASDEYPEWVNTVFNDVFAFYVNGTNYATVRQVAGDPASPFVPVAVNNINNGNALYPDYLPMRPDLFRANYFDPNGPSAIDLEQDGLTSVLIFQAPVTPGVTNHMRLAIADASDGIYDSAVFIQAGSLVSNENPVADLSVTPQTGAAPQTITAIIEAEDPNGLPLTYTINWGDGSSQSTGPLNQPTNEAEKTALVNHTYITPGTYIVTLTVSNGTLSGVSQEDVDIIGTATPGAPVVTGNPSDQTVPDGSFFSFSASASGLPAPNVQWQVSTDAGATFTDIPGATSTTYVATASLADSGNLYQAVFTNNEGTVTTSPALLTVGVGISAPFVTEDPTDQQVLEGEFFIFSASASGFPAPTVQWQVSTDYGATFSDIPGATDTTYIAQASLVDNGSLFRAVFTNDEDTAISNFAMLTVLPVDSTPSVAPGVALSQDTGSLNDDLITQVGDLNLSDLEADATVEFSTDSGSTWTGSFTAAEGLNTILVRQTDVAGNVSATTPFSFTLDTSAPAAPGVALSQDTGSLNNDLITQVGDLNLNGIEANATVEYSTDSGVTWTGGFTAAEGLNTVLVRQTDVAGNVSDTTTFSFTLDTTVTAPGVALSQDTGSLSNDKVTQVGNLTLSGLESGAKVQFSPDNGITWNGSFSAKEGLNTVLVRQTDGAGNVSNATTFSFTLDTTKPQLNPTFSQAGPFLVGATGITVSVNASDAGGIATQFAGTVNTSTAGLKVVTCSATDLAGNTTSVNVSYIVGYKAINVTPTAGKTFKRGSSIPVTFQLADANGRISDQAAANLLSSITVSLGNLTTVSAKYSSKTHTFTATLTTSKKATVGTYDITIRITLNGTEVMKVLDSIKLI